MHNRTIKLLKCIVFPLCLLPLARLIWFGVHQDLGADPVAEITHVTGNWTMYMLLLSLAITPVRHLSPRLTWLIRFRRMIGLYAFFYASLHLATYIFLFSGYDLPAAWAGLTHGRIGAIWTQWRVVWPTVVRDLEKRRFIQVGLFAWLILLALAITSPTFMLRRMGGKNWQRLHRLVYVAAAAGCVHYWWLVKKGVQRPMPDTLILTGLLLARVIWLLIKRTPSRPRVAAQLPSR